MIPISEFKKLLGDAALGLTDTEVEHMRKLGDLLCDVIFETWLRKRNADHYVAEFSEK